MPEETNSNQRLAHIVEGLWQAFHRIDDLASDIKHGKREFRAYDFYDALHQDLRPNIEALQRSSS